MAPEEFFNLIDQMFEQHGKKIFSEMLEYLHEQKKKNENIPKPFLSPMSDNERVLMERSIFCITEMVNCYLNTKLVFTGDYFSICTLDQAWSKQDQTYKQTFCVRLVNGKVMHLLEETDDFKEFFKTVPKPDQKMISMLMEVADAFEYDWKQYKDKSLHTLFEKNYGLLGVKRFCDYYRQDLDLLQPYLERHSLMITTSSSKDIKPYTMGKKM